MSVRVTILGCGSSGGVPRVAQGWGKCDPSEPRNRRRRCSILVERFGKTGKTAILVDTSPDLREQLIDAGITHLDGVIITHEHADHTHGIDDLRPLVIHNRRRVPVYADAQTLDILLARFAYCFHTPAGSDYPPILTAHTVPKAGKLSINGAGGPIQFETFRLEHGNIDVLGLRFAGLAYTPDLSAIPPESDSALAGLNCWIIDALRETTHPSHFSLGEALAAIARFAPRRAILTDLHTDLDYGRLCRDLPDRIEPAYDGMTIDLPEETTTNP